MDAAVKEMRVGTTNGWDDVEEHYFGQGEAAADPGDCVARRRWRSIILSCVIIAISGAVMGLMIWGGR